MRHLAWSFVAIRPVAPLVPFWHRTGATEITLQQGLCKPAIFTDVKELNHRAALNRRVAERAVHGLNVKLLPCSSSFGMFRPIFPGKREIAAG